MGKFSKSVSKQKEAMSSNYSRSKKPSRSFFKFNEVDSKIAILPAPISHGENAKTIFELPRHEIWSNGKLVKSCVCPPMGEKNEIEQLSINLYVKAKKVADEKLKKKIQELAASLKPKINYFANIIDVTQKKYKVEQVRLPVSVANVYYETFFELDDDDESLTDPENIRPFKISTNGKKGLAKEYKAVLPLPKTIDLTAVIDEDELEEQCANLEVEFGEEFDEKSYNDLLAYAQKQANKFLDASEDDDDIDYSEEDDDDSTGDEGDDDLDLDDKEDDLDEDLDLDDDDDIDLDDEDLDDEDDIEQIEEELKDKIRKFKKTDKSDKKTRIALKKEITKLKEKLASLKD